LVAIAAGVILLALVSPTVRTVGIVVGVALLASAMFELVELFRDDDPTTRTDRIIAIVAFAAAGALVLAWPTITQLALLYAAGISAVVFGAAEAAALTTRPFSERERWLGGVSSVVALFFGIALLAHPGSSLNTAINLLGIYLIVTGGLRLVQAADAWHRRWRLERA
jgi:uncharacterized membrane protein HdeD (DUF308 family)